MEPGGLVCFDVAWNGLPSPSAARRNSHDARDDPHHYRTDLPAWRLERPFWRLWLWPRTLGDGLGRSGFGGSHRTLALRQDLTSITLKQLLFFIYHDLRNWIHHSSQQESHFPQTSLY